VQMKSDSKAEDMNVPFYHITSKLRTRHHGSKIILFVYSNRRKEAGTHEGGDKKAKTTKNNKKLATLGQPEIAIPPSPTAIVRNTTA